MGQEWYRHFKKTLQEIGAKVHVVQEQEHFKFRASKLFTTKQAAIFPVGLGGRVVVLRVSIVDGDVPSLLSKPALIALGMEYDLAGGRADFKKIGVKDYKLGNSEHGHPTV